MKRIQDEFIGLITISLFAFSIPTFAQDVTGQLSAVGDATHLEFQGKADWNYDVQKESDKTLILTVPAFDDATLVKLQTWSDKYIQAVEVDKDGPDKSYQVKFHLSSADVEMFDYLTDQPSRLILDFYAKTPAPVAEKAPVKKTKKAIVREGKLPEKKQNNQASSDYKKVERGIASSELLIVDPATAGNQPTVVAEEPMSLYPQTGIFDSGDPDYSRFQLKDYQVKEESIIASHQNIYIQFPYLKMENDRFIELMSDRPEYEIKTTESEENKEARLLMTLHDSKRHASFEKVYKHFINKYPKSKYLEIAHNLAIEVFAEQYIQSGDRNEFDNFRSILKMLIEKYPSSPLDERYRLLLSYSALKQREALAAVREMDDYLQKYPQSSEKDRINISRAEAFLILRKPEKSSEILGKVEKESGNEKTSVEAAYRLGDVEMEFKNYDKAAKLYEQQLSKYPNYKSVYPNALYNLSESYFWKKDYKKSLETFVEFLKNYPAHDHGGFALTRVGELLDILGADQRQIMGAFIEAYFRYPNNAGSKVARVRMLAGALRNMKDKQRRIALSEMQEIKETSTLPKIDEFTTLMIADGLSKGGDFQDSLARLESFYQQNPTTANFEIFKARILRNISDILDEKLNKREFLSALDFYGKYIPKWLRQSDRIDTEFFHALAFEQAGVFAEAEKEYKAVAARLKKIKGSKEEKERKVYEHLPSLDSVQLRLAAVALQQGKYQEAYAFIKNADAQLSDEEQIEKVQIGAEVAKQSGDTLAAISYLQKLIKNWNGKPELLMNPYLKLGRLYLDQSKKKDAEDVMEKVAALPKPAVEASDDSLSQYLQLKADVLLSQGKKEEAVKTYLELLEKFESKRPLESVRYQAGKIKFEMGDIKTAEQIWSRLSDDKENLYRKLAQEQLNQSDWQGNYKKYIDRIPAAKELK